MENIILDRKYEISKENTKLGDMVINVHGTISTVVGVDKNNNFILCFASSESKNPVFYTYDEHESNFNYCVNLNEPNNSYLNVYKEA